jgi:eukaryotic-like serine/threonine-protein kinase
VHGLINPTVPMESALRETETVRRRIEPGRLCHPSDGSSAPNASSGGSSPSGVWWVVTEMSESRVTDAESGVRDNRVGGRYRLIEVIGAGGMGRVWLAEDELLRRPVAVKEIAVAPEDLLDTQLRTMREARAAARLDHPGVVKVFDVVWHTDRSWIVMEYVKSRSLHEVVLSDGPLDHQQAARLGLQVLAALRAAHRGGVLHRDVKPHNVLLAEDGRIVLSDFGLASTGDPDGPGEPIMGSPYYVAPERLRPGGVSDAAADLWSLGATLYSATQGRPPFARESTADSLAAVLADEPDPTRHPGPLTPVILDLLSKDPARRPSAADLEPRLRRIATSIPAPRSDPDARARGRAQVPATPVVAPLVDPPAPAGPPRTKRLVLAGVAFLVVAAAGTAMALTDRRDDRPVAVAASPKPPSASATVPAVATVNPCGFGAETIAVRAATARVPAGLPTGYLWFRDPTGFALALPAGWRRSAAGTAVCFSGPAGDRAFTVDSAALVTREPLDYWQTREKAAIAGRTLPGYQRISMGVLLLRRGGADWEYTWRPDSDTVQHVRRILVATTDTRSYLLQWATSDADWSRGVAQQRQLVNFFQFAG